MTEHKHWYVHSRGTSPMCGCGAWPSLVAALEAEGIPAERMSLDRLLRDAAMMWHVPTEMVETPNGLLMKVIS